MSQNSVSKEVKLALLQQERQNWLNTYEILTIRHRVNGRLGNKAAVDECVKEMERCELALSELEKIEKELNTVDKVAGDGN